MSDRAQMCSSQHFAWLKSAQLRAPSANQRAGREPALTASVNRQYRMQHPHALASLAPLLINVLLPGPVPSCSMIIIVVPILLPRLGRPPHNDARARRGTFRWHSVAQSAGSAALVARGYLQVDNGAVRVSRGVLEVLVGFFSVLWCGERVPINAQVPSRSCVLSQHDLFPLCDYRCVYYCTLCHEIFSAECEG